MSVNCNDFLKLAKDALSNANDEIEFRNIISRAYYSSYHRIKPLLSTSAPKTHSALIDYLCNANDTYCEDIDSVTLREIGLILEQEKVKRVTADYFLKRKITRFDSEVSIENAEEFKRMIESI